ncbi:MAG: TRAP transporter, 4TM/12TM fusion protein [Synergistales bacterium 53_16]|nr:MAG: TRAP transporter, 4TM/12TM fusion protein [Synergistales bacterium 53_16]
MCMSTEVTQTQEIGLKSKIVIWGGLVFATAQLIVPVFIPLVDIQLRALHIIMGLSVALLAFPFSQRAKGKGLSLIDYIQIGIIIAANVNVMAHALQIYMRPGSAGTLDLVLGVALILVILDAARRSVGWAIPVFVALLLLYIFAGSYFPGMWKLKGLSLNYVLNSLYWSALGVYGSVTGMSATFISMFIIFGALIAGAGGGRTFIDLALALTGRYSGGPAKTAVIASALFGSISGSGVANVSVTGNYTIPLMKRLGYNKDFAGAVEAIASTGGGVTPPLMSITAFMMAEFLGIPYIKVIGYALVPCLLFYTGVMGGVHFQTIKAGLGSVPEDEIPPWREILTFRRMAPLVIPTAVLLYSIGTGRPLVFAGFYACVACLVVYFISEVPKVGVKAALRHIGNALSDGGVGLARIVPVLVAVNILVNMIGITGIAPKLSGLIMSIGGDNLILSLFIATIVPFLLGTSLPVVPTYVLCLSILVPPLLKLGVDEVSAHLFFIYWSLLGGVTPPTCTQAIVAAGIAGGDWVKTGFLSVRLGVVAFIIPYFFVLNPALVGRAPLVNVFITAGTGFVGALALAYSLFGHFRGILAYPSRVLYFAAGLALLYPNRYVSLIGLVVAAATWALDRFQRKQKGPSSTPAEQKSTDSD